MRDARDMAEFLEEVAPAGGVLAKVLAVSKEHALGFADSYLLHDELETYNAPRYFYEMLGRAGEHGLTYLAEAHPETMIPANFGPRVAEYLQEKCGGVQVLVEQYLDFVLNRMFRESLLIHSERAPQIRYDVDRSRFRHLHISAWVPPVEGEIRLDDSHQEFLESDGATLVTDDPGVKAALDALCVRWPWTLSRQELIDGVQARLASAGLTPSVDLPDHVDDLIGVLIVQGAARFRLEPVLPEPVAGNLRLDETARRMAELSRHDSDASTFNLWHETLILTSLERHLLPLLDGTRDREALIEALTDHDADGIDALIQRLVEMKLIRIE